MGVLLHGFSDSIAYNIISNNNSVRLWVRPGGSDNTNNEIYNKIKNKFPIIKGRDFIDGNFEKEIEYALPERVYRLLYKKAFHPFMRCHARRFRCPFNRHHFVFYEHAFMIFAQRCYQLIKKHRIETIAFAQIPHKGADVILYYLSHILNLKTALCLQNPGLKKDCYILISSIDDIGVYINGMRKKSIPINITPPQEKPFYTNRYRRKYLHAGKEITQSVAQAVASIITLRPPSSRRTHLDRVCRALARMKFLKTKSDKEISRTKIEKIMQQNSYVYAPLHLEPEMVIDVLGGRYREQTLFILKLREIVPSDVHIIVKENPAQTTYARDRHFITSITSLKNVHYTKEDIDTFTLIRNSQAVAAVLGTAGWEALRFGKPVIIGGHAWYRPLPGVFHIDEISWQAITEYVFDADRLATEVEKLSYYHRQGILANFSLYAKFLPDFDREQNAQRVGRDVAEYINWLQEQ